MNDILENLNDNHNIIIERINVVSHMGKRYFEIEGLDIKFYRLEPLHEWSLGLGKIQVSRHADILDFGNIVILEPKFIGCKRSSDFIKCFTGLCEIPMVERQTKDYAEMLYADDFKEGDEIVIKFIKSIAHEITTHEVRDLAYFVKKAYDHRLRMAELRRKHPYMSDCRLSEIIHEREKRGIDIPILYPDVKVMDKEDV